MRRLHWVGLLVVAAVGAAAVACGDGQTSDAEFASPRSPGANGSAPPNAGAGAQTDAGGPAEREVESEYEVPVATGRFVWVANPKSGRVAYIDAVSLEVKTAEAGNGPTYLAPVSGANDATVVVNVLSEDATLLRVEASGQLLAKTFPTAPNHNAWSISPDGRWAIAWSDARKLAKNDPTQGYQDLTVIDLTGAVAPQILAVGYRPVTVGFNATSTTAYAVTQDGISLVDLAAPAPIVTKNVAISDTPLTDPGSRDVAVTPDGKLALVRRDGESIITVVSLETGVRTPVTLPANATDLDLSKDGTRAVAVMRDTAQVAILPVPEIVGAPGTYTTVTITGETVGSVALSESGTTGILYSNAVSYDRLSVLDMSGTPSYRTIRLYAPVLGVFPSFDARHAVVLHDMSGVVGARPGAFSLVPLVDPLPAKIVGLDAPAIGVAVSPAGDAAVIATRSDTTRTYAAHIGWLPSLRTIRLPLASPPTAVGIVPTASRAFVGQVHPDGRLTFIDLATGQARTLTGFELGARVVDGQ